MAKPTGFDSGFGPGFGVGRYYYGLQQYIWDMTTGPGTGFWRLPASVVGAVDLRTLPQQATVGGTPQGFAFVASMQPIDVQIARSLHFNDENVTSLMQDALEAELGFRPQGAKVVDLLWDILTSGSDPEGQVACKPLMAGVDSLLKLFVGGHSLVKEEQFRFGIHPHTGKVRDLLRRQFEAQWEATNGHDHCRRCLDFTCKKYKVADWKEFVPQRLHGHVPGRLPHRTTITESFNTGDSTTLGPDLSWSEFFGDFAVSSNTAISNSGSPAVAKADSDLSSDDHYAEVVFVTSPSYSGTATRFNATPDFYSGRNTDGIFKRVGGVLTSIGGTVGGWGAGDVLRLESNGSSHVISRNGTPGSPVTDTAITGNLRCGIVIHAGFGVQLDDFEAADLGGGPATFTGTSALTISNQTLSATATHEPEHTATSDLTVANQTLSASATHETPEFTGTAALTVTNQVLAATAEHDTPIYTGTADLNISNQILVASGTTAPPGAHTGTSVLTISNQSLAASATFDAPIYTGTASLSITNQTLAASAQNEPEFTATSALTISTQTLTAAGFFANDLFLATSVLTISNQTLAAVATFSGVALEFRERLVIDVPDSRFILNTPAETRLVVDLEQ